MKKFLTAAVAFGMVAGVAATASALDLKTSGKYYVDGYWVKGATSTGVNPWDDSSDSDWYQHKFQLNSELVVNDMVSIKTDIRLIDSYTTWVDTAGTNNGGYVDVNKLWLVYKSPIGRLEIGRRPGGAWGHTFIDSATNADRIMLYMGEGEVTGYVFTQKLAENDMAGGVDSDSPVVSGFNGADRDYYEGGVQFKTEGVDITAALGTTQQDSADYSMYRAKVSGTVAAGPGNLVFEADYKTGEQSSTDDINSYAALVAFAGEAGNVKYLAGVATITGDNTADDENTAYDAANGTGWDFQPLYIMTGNRMNVLNGERGADAVGTTVRQAGVVAAVLTADYKVSEDMSLHAGFGVGGPEDAPAGWSDGLTDYGYEFDLGMGYQLYQNLTYDLHLGYWMVGDFADLGGMVDTEDVMLLSNHLTMSF